MRKNTYILPASGSASGGAYSTAGDLLRFTRAVLSDRLLSPEYTDWLLTGNLPAPGERTPRTSDGINASGGNPGIGTMLSCDLERPYTVILLTNRDPEIVMNLGRKIERILDAVRQWPERGFGIGRGRWGSGTGCRDSGVGIRVSGSGRRVSGPGATSHPIPFTRPPRLPSPVSRLAVLSNHLDEPDDAVVQLIELLGGDPPLGVMMVADLVDLVAIRHKSGRENVKLFPRGP